MGGEMQEKVKQSIFFGLFRKKQEEIPKVIIPGVELSDQFYDPKESRIKTLFLKGLLVYALVGGGTGSYVSAIGCEYHEIQVQFAIFGFAMLIALMHYNRLLEDLAYVMGMILVIGMGLYFSAYINSGFYEMVNQTFEQASEYFDLSGVKTYSISINNESLTVTVSLIFLGIVLSIFTHLWITKYMRYYIVIPVFTVLLAIPSYLELKSSFYYLALLLAGLFFSFILRGTNNYALKSDDYIFDHPKKKKRHFGKKPQKQEDSFQFTYRYSFVATGQMFGIVALLVACLVIIINRIFSGSILQTMDNKNQLKNETKEVVSRVAESGFAGLFNQYNSSGGMNHGRFGGVDSVTLDYNTDLILEFVPYTMDRIYLKSFTGDIYNSEDRYWEPAKDQSEGSQLGAETEKKKKEYEMEANSEYGNVDTAKAVMNIKDITSGSVSNPQGEKYYPYYSDAKDSKVVLQGDDYYHQIVTYYPELTDWKRELSGLTPLGELVAKADLTRGDYLEEDLEIPEVNQRVIETFCERNGLVIRENGEINDWKDLAQAIQAYYQENIPYTYSPGATPKGEDFINYFLRVGKKGFCVHFASAAVMMFRYNNIPARYVEGYGVDISNSGENLASLDEDPKDFYKGYNPLSENVMISLDVTDASAHAWVEVYDETDGWQVVDITPGSSENYYGGSFLQALFGRINTSGNQSNSTDAITTVQETGKNIFKTAGVMLFVVVFLILSLILGILLIKMGREQVLYHRASMNDRLILDYKKKCKTYKKHNPAFDEKINFKEQLDLLQAQEKIKISDPLEFEKLLKILNQAAFSNHQISKEEYSFVKKHL